MKKLWVLNFLALCAIAGSTWASEVVTEVIRMQKSGSDASALTAYIQKSEAVSLSSDEIIELQSAGVPPDVITAMLDREGTAPTAEVATDAPADAPEFTTALASYGTWSDDAEYGHVFTPAEAVNADWQPYVDNGTWVYTDQGWFWNSSYAWGWAPFHYGRWAHRDHWVWIPDNVWGPAWVSWRQGDNFYGWAPLTPRARFQAGVGFNFGSGNVDVALGLGERDYFFVPSHSFLEVNLRSSGLRGSERSRVYNETKITNNYTVTNNRVVNQGIAPTAVATATKKEVKPLSIAAQQGKPGEKGGASRIAGGKVEVFRPATTARSNATTTNRRPVAQDVKADPRKAELAAKVREQAKSATAAQKNDPAAARQNQNANAERVKEQQSKQKEERAANEAERTKEQQAKQTQVREQNAERVKEQQEKQTERANEQQTKEAQQRAKIDQAKQQRTEREAPQKTETPRATERETPRATERETPRATERETPRTPERQTPRATERETPRQAESVRPEPKTAPRAEPKAEPEPKEKR